MQSMFNINFNFYYSVKMMNKQEYFIPYADMKPFCGWLKMPLATLHIWWPVQRTSRLTQINLITG